MAILVAAAAALPACGGGGDGATSIAGTATSNISIDASADGSLVAVGWYDYDAEAAVERALVAVSTDGGRSFGRPVVVTEPSAQFPDVAVLDDGTILVGTITYDASRLIDPDNPRSWPGWPVIHRSTDGGATFEVMADLQDTVAERVLTGAMPTSIAASGDGATIVFSYQDHTPASRVAVGEPAVVADTSAVPTWAVVSTDGGATFGAPQVVADSTCSCCQSTAFVDSNRAAVAMRLLDQIDDNSDERDPAMNLSDASGRFGEPVEIHDDGYVMPFDGCPASGPGVVSVGGTIHAAWWSGAQDRRGWWYSTGSSPESMAEPMQLEAPYSITYAVHTAADASGQAWVVGMHWPDKDAGYYLHLWHIDQDGRPATLDLRPTVDGAAQAYDITDTDGGALVAWIEAGAPRVRRLEP